MPRPPAWVTAAASLPPAAEPIGASRIGCWIPSSRVSAVSIVAMLSPAEAGLAARAPGIVRLGLVLAHFEHHEPVSIDQRGIRDVGDVLTTVHRLLDHAHGE